MAIPRARKPEEAENDKGGREEGAI